MSVDKAVVARPPATSSALGPMEIEELEPVWDQRHTKEAEHQEKKRRKIQIEADMGGTLLPEEVVDCLPQEAAGAEATKRKKLR